MVTSTALRRRSSIAWLAITAAVLVVAGVGRADAQERPLSEVSIDLGTADGQPGSTVSLPVIIAVPEEIVVTAFEQEIRFEKQLLSFVRAELAPQGTAAGVELSTSVEDDPDDRDRSILRMKGTAARPLGTGAVADLLFRIDEDAEAPRAFDGSGHLGERAMVALENQARVRIGQGELAAVTGRDGEVEITESVLIFGCFFYMH